MSNSIKDRIKFFKFNSCIRKKRYATLKEGLIALLKHRDNGWTVNNVYKCLFCECYHVGQIRKQTRYRVKKVIEMIGEVYGS